MIPSRDHDIKIPASVTPQFTPRFPTKSLRNKWWRVPETIFSNYPPASFSPVYVAPLDQVTDRKLSLLTER